MLEGIGITRKNASESLRHAFVITASGFLILTAMGYFLGFGYPEVDYYWMAFYVIVSVPLQEIIFRGILQTQLYRFGRRNAIAASSILYSAIHFGNPLLLILTLIAGLFWGYSFSMYKTLAGPIASHAVLGVYLFLFVL